MVKAMTRTEFIHKVKEIFDSLPARERDVATYILNNPKDVALLSMRAQGREANVPAATLTRFAQRVGLQGYDDLRAIYAAALRGSADAFGGRAKALVDLHREVGVEAVAAEMAQGLAEQVARLGASSQIGDLVGAATLLSEANRIFCLGHRGSFPVAYQFAHVTSFFDDRAVLLATPGGSATSRIIEARDGDVLLVVSYLPSSRQVVETVAYAKRQGLKVICITPNNATPVGRLSDCVIVVPGPTHSFFDSMTPAFAACEMLVALVAGMVPGEVAQAVSKREEELWDLGVWWGIDEELPPGTRVDQKLSKSKPKGGK